jgi:hypothetical protein
MSDAKERHLRVVRPGAHAHAPSALSEIQPAIARTVAEIHQEYRRQVAEAAHQYLAAITVYDDGRAR